MALRSETATARLEIAAVDEGLWALNNHEAGSVAGGQIRRTKRVNLHFNAFNMHFCNIESAIRRHLPPSPINSRRLADNKEA